MKQIWKQLWALLTLAMQDEKKISEQEWLRMARQFGSHFVARYCKEDVTPYLHVLVYHVGFYLEKYGNLEIFANYAIEGRHRYNKLAIPSGTSGFNHPSGPHNVQYQLITRSWREDDLQSSLNEDKTGRHKPSWVQKSLPAFLDVDSVFSM